MKEVKRVNMRQNPSRYPLNKPNDDEMERINNNNSPFQKKRNKSNGVNAAGVKTINLYNVAKLE